MDIRVLDENPLYRGEIYRLPFRFSASYPIRILSHPSLNSLSHTLIPLIFLSSRSHTLISLTRP